MTSEQSSKILGTLTVNMEAELHELLAAAAHCVEKLKEIVPEGELLTAQINRVEILNQDGESMTGTISWIQSPSGTVQILLDAELKAGE